MTFTLLANAILGAAVLFSLIAGICAINGTPISLGLHKLAQRVNTERAERAKSATATSSVRIGLGS